jgi:hypothetical protein
MSGAAVDEIRSADHAEQDRIQHLLGRAARGRVEDLDGAAHPRVDGLGPDQPPGDGIGAGSRALTEQRHDI